MKAAIAIDGWKTSIFEERLTKAGFTYEKINAVIKGSDMIVLKVETEDTEKLALTVMASEKEAQMMNSADTEVVN